MELLMRKVQSGDEQAFSELYDETIDDVYRTIYFLVRDRNDIDDIVQDTYLQIHKLIHKFDVTKPVKPWVTGIAIKVVQNYRKKLWRLFRLPLQEAKTTQLETNVEWLEALNILPFKLRQVVVLRYVEQYRQEEIATMLQIPVGTVKSRLNQALTKLRQHTTLIGGIAYEA